MRFTIAQQQKVLDAKQPRTWSWRYLFKVLLEIQHNQERQIKLLESINKKKFGITLPKVDDELTDLQPSDPETTAETSEAL